VSLQLERRAMYLEYLGIATNNQEDARNLNKLNMKETNF